MNALNLNLSKKHWLVLLLVFVLFLALRLPGTDALYHQDEYKWPLYAEAKIFEPGTVPHPPLTEFIYRIIGREINPDNFRFIPLTFSIANFFLIFYLAKLLFDKRTAFITVFLFSISFYSILASLMVDTDGSVMPFFALLSSIFYLKWKEKKFFNWFLIPLLAAVIGGFLIKASFAVFVGALILEYAFEKRLFSNRKGLLRLIGTVVGIGVLLVVVLLISKFIFPFFNLDKSLTYWKHFAVLDRGWMQTFIQFAKAILYTSPLLIIPAFFADREIFRKTRLFYIFIFAGLFFYLFAFDFSLGALDRYFEFLVVPLCIIAGAVISKFLLGGFIPKKDKILFGIIAILIFAVQFFNHFVPPHHPKTEWIERAIALKWNFLFPFTGGSGPTGFYISFLFMALFWLISIAFLVSGYVKGNLKSRILFGIILFGLVYNAVFIEEHLFGKINGSPYNLFPEAFAIIKENNDIKNVITYNDIGGHEIRQTGKYQRRLYAAPQFEHEYREVFKNFNGHILFIDIPRVDPNSLYTKYFDSCEAIYSKTDKYITAKLLSCKPAVF